MDKVLNFPRPEEGPAADVEAGMLDRANRTFICTSLFLDIVEYAKKPVSQQLRVKEHFNARLSEALQDIAVNDRIILDTGDGAAINFLGDPEDALFVAISLAQAFAKPEGALPLDVRIGINLGPVRLVRDINGQFNIIGDGINVAERVMSFGGSGQVLVSRSYFEVVTRISEDYSQLFAYQGSRTDKHVREHEIYAVASSGAAALDVTARRHRARPALKLIDNTQAVAQAPKALLRRLTLPYAAAALSALALTCAVVYYVSDRAASGTSDAARFAPAIRLPEAPSAQTAAAPASVPQIKHEASSVAGAIGSPETTEPGKSVAAPGSRIAAKKPARKAVHATEAVAQAPSEAPSALPVAVKTAGGETPTAGTEVTPWKPYKEQKAAPTPAVSEPDATGSPYTAAAHKPASALVMLAVSPWGEVVVDGKSAGVSPPLSELELAPGTHRVEIKNGDFTPHLLTLQLEPNQTVRIKHKFTQR